MAGKMRGKEDFYGGTIMQKVKSKDGTQIAYDRQGEGPALILVDGALCFRSFGPMPELASLLAPHFTVYNYDRRGRGESGDTKPFAVEREVEDLEALINEAGRSTYLYGVSSGGALALEAAIGLVNKVKKLAIYEAPYNSSEGSVKEWKEYVKGLTDLLKEDRRGDMAALFMQFVGTPVEQIGGMRQSPIWPVFESVAPTLVYDAVVLGEERLPPTKRAGRITAATLVMNGGAGLPFIAEAAKTLAKAIPDARHRILEGQRHDVSNAALAPVLVEFFKT
jgi:pimeloyl-ACP methyl ester carboxylesterase